MSGVIAFAGQGSQHGAMFRLLYDNHFGRDWLKKASDLIGIDLFDEARVNATCFDVVDAQLLIAILEVGAFYTLENATPLSIDFLCGYSLGEVSAFCVSAKLPLEAVCELVKNRAVIMQDALALESTELAVLKGRINLQLINALLENYSCFLAIINAPDHVIVGGTSANLDQLLEHAKKQGVLKAERLAVNIASHTPLLAKASDDFAIYLQHHFSNYHMRFSILNALSQELIADTSTMLAILAKELSHTLHWDRVMLITLEYGVRWFLELGPGNALKKMMQVHAPQLRAYNLEAFASISGLIKLMTEFHSTLYRS